MPLHIYCFKICTHAHYSQSKDNYYPISSFFCRIARWQVLVLWTVARHAELDSASNVTVCDESSTNQWCHMPSVYLCLHLQILCMGWKMTWISNKKNLTITHWTIKWISVCHIFIACSLFFWISFVLWIWKGQMYEYDVIDWRKLR